MHSLLKMAIEKPRGTVHYLKERLGIKEMDDEEYIKWRWFRFNGTEINLDSPRTFDDKLNWLKIHDRNPLYTKLVDKYKVKEFVAGKIGEQYVIPLIKDSSGGVYSDFDEINFDKLPDRFVLKTNHDCCGVAICTEKKHFDIDKVRSDFKYRVNRDYSIGGREWPYKGVERKIICEEYVENLEDHNYKFFVFDGKMKFVYVAPYREQTVDYFDEDYNHLDIYTRLHKCATMAPSKPECFEKMVEIAEKLGEGIPEVRVDLYESKGRIFFGEMTFFHEAGFTPFLPDKWNQIFGDLIQLPHLS